VLDDVRAYADTYGGAAVATRWPHRVVEAADQRLPEDPAVPWYALGLSVPIPDTGELLFIAPTSSWRLDAEASRERQAMNIAALDAHHRAALRRSSPAISTPRRPGHDGYRAHLSARTGPAQGASPYAEDARFELARGCPQHAFQACALGH
jgi:hypothetical protein